MVVSSTLPPTRRRFFHDVIIIIIIIIVHRFSAKKAAAEAIVAVHGTEVGGHTVKCSWGKESSEPGQGAYQSGPAGANSAVSVRGQAGGREIGRAHV